MSLISIPNVFSAGAVIIASQHNVNFSTIYSEFNGNIQNVNIASDAAITADKLDLTTASAVGTVTPDAGKFTTLEATTTFKLGTTHQGDILYDNGTSLVRLTPGTSGYYLKTQGTSSNPTWAAVTVPTSFSQLFTASGTFTAPAGITKVYITMIGGGGSGGGAQENGVGHNGGGGSSAAYLINYPYTVTPASGYTVTIGAGGAGVASSGTDGGNTTFDAVTVVGGKKGVAGTDGAGGAAVGGFAGTTYVPAANFSFISTAGTAGSSGSVSGAGAGSPFGKGGVGINGGTSVGGNALGYGAGGGGAADNGTDTSIAGGNGSGGFVLVQY